MYINMGKMHWLFYGKNIHHIECTDDKKHDIVIEGLGFFTVKKGKYEIFTLKGCNVFVRNSFI